MNISIRFKLFAAVIGFTLVAGAVLALVVRIRTERVAEHLGEAALQSSLEAFQTLQDADRRMLSAALVALTSDKELAALLEKRDRDGLFAKASPVFERLGVLDITHLYFETPAEEGTVLLRVHDAANHGDKLTRLTYQSAAKDKAMAAGLELGKTAFALRVVAPFDREGKHLGFVELGKEIDEFIHLIKQQTGNDAAILLDKSKLDEGAWKQMRMKEGLDDNWAAHGDYVIAASSMADSSLVDFAVPIADLPPKGKTFAQAERDGRTYVRGAFPILDAGGKPMGAVYLVHDATLVVDEMNSLLYNSAGMAAVLAVLLVAAIFIIFTVLVEKRLHQLTNDAMRILGGDYDTTIQAGPNDEIGKFERLFEQFRVVFVDAVRGGDEKVPK